MSKSNIKKENMDQDDIKYIIDLLKDSIYSKDLDQVEEAIIYLQDFLDDGSYGEE